ncbi:hypothetical protein [Methylocystis hirsuta]|uniref:hypothetical protein n=1 Tax=Methylocystis hirsuta TaxID=369798 RepID=UPI0011CD851A|nr:hypothetical protein [Methylocystis hirsuta]
MKNVKKVLTEVAATASQTYRVGAEAADEAGRALSALGYALSPLKKYSRDTVKFVRTECCPNPNCDRNLGSNWNDRSRIKLYDENGNETSYGLLKKDIRNFECNHCHYNWPYLKPADSLELVDTTRSEESFGEDKIIIDNSDSDVDITRRLEFTKEWVKSYDVEYEKTEGKNTERAFGLKDGLLSKKSAEKKITQTYSINENTRETKKEEITLKIPPRTHVVLYVKWKKIWQNGLIKVLRNEDVILIPFHVCKEVTFDLEQKSSI